MNFIDDIWRVCAEQQNLERFSISLFHQHILNLHFSSAWPINGIKRALAINICEDNAGQNSWQVYSITQKEFDVTPFVNSYYRDQHCKLDLKGSSDVVAFYDSLNQIFRAYDLKNRRAVIIHQLQPIFNEWEVHCPLREFFHIWALQNNALLIHSGIVSSEGKAVLLPGAGGSGKSTTTLSCLQNNMKTTGDDYNIIFNDNGVFRACPIYGNVKLKTAKTRRTSFELNIINNWESEDVSYAEKRIYFPPVNSAIWDRSYPQLVGILCPNIPTPSPAEPEITVMRPAELINRLAISSIMQSPFMAKEYLAMSVSLAKQVRIAYLNLSTDIKANSNSILTCLKNS